jgi:hypothetical protein
MWVSPLWNMQGLSSDALNSWTLNNDGLCTSSASTSEGRLRNLELESQVVPEVPASRLAL